jgi:hypothetical protein
MIELDSPMGRDLMLWAHYRLADFYPDPKAAFLRAWETRVPGKTLREFEAHLIKTASQLDTRVI